MATMKDVAEASGVSLITVSRVINTPERVADATREKVEQAMARLHFLPNHTAKALAENSTRTIHLYVPRSAVLSEPFMMNLIAGVAQELSDAFYLLLVRRDLAFNQRCDGVIVMGLELDEENSFAEKLDVPFVLFGKSDGDVDCIDVDNRSGAEMMASHLVSLGHHRVGFLMLDVNQRYAYERLEGYRMGLEAHGIPFDRSLVRTVVYSEQDAYEKARDMIESERPTALFCCNDLLALGAFRAAEALGIQIPDGLSVAGFDSLVFDLIPKVPLTTVRQPVFETGQALARRMLDRLKDPTLPLGKVFITPELVLRQSVGPVVIDP